jgi:hypothetical protein
MYLFIYNAPSSLASNWYPSYAWSMLGSSVNSILTDFIKNHRSSPNAVPIYAFDMSTQQYVKTVADSRELPSRSSYGFSNEFQSEILHRAVSLALNEESHV